MTHKPTDFDLQDNEKQAYENLIDSNDQATIGCLGAFIAMILLAFAIFCSFKMYHVFTTPDSEHTGFAILFGIPCTLLLYLLAYKSLQVRNAEIMPESTTSMNSSKKKKKQNDDVEYHIPKSNVTAVNVLFSALLILLKTISTLVFGVSLIMMIKDFSADKIPIILTLLLLLCWTHFSTLKRLGIMNGSDIVIMMKKYQNIMILFFVIIACLQFFGQ